jgi:hypothetical protein
MGSRYITSRDSRNADALASERPSERTRDRTRTDNADAMVKHNRLF